jgi:membrane-associated phospholipid phosphatase
MAKAKHSPTSLKESTNTLIKAGTEWIWGFALVCLILLAVIYFGDLNRDLFFAINGFAAQFVDKLWARVTFFSDGLVTFVILLPFIYRKPQYIWAVLLAAILFTLAGQGIKHLMNVPRPPRVLEPHEFNLIGPDWGQNAFPSGHASMVFNLVGVFILTTAKKWLRWILLAVGTFIAFSRIAVGVHWPLDVVAGMLMGWLTIWLGLKLVPYTRWGWSGIGQKILGVLLLVACAAMFFADYTGFINIMTEQRVIAAVFFLVGASEYLRLYNIHVFGRSQRKSAKEQVD